MADVSRPGSTAPVRTVVVRDGATKRVNAPLLCHVLGVARASGASLDQLAGIVRERDTDR